MRPKKRYLLLREYPRTLSKDCDFLYQDGSGYVFRVPLASVESVPPEIVILKSGSLRKIKQFGIAQNAK